jgi:hypothetical protein
MGGHGNFVFNLVVKLSVELGYVFLSLRLLTASMSSALLSVLLVCNRRIVRHRGKFSNMLCSFREGMPGILVTEIKQCVQR